MDSRNFAIGILSTTAVILFVGLVLTLSRPAPVYASGMGDRGGDYNMLSGAIWEQEEVLYVINTAMDRMITYKYDRQTGRVIVAQGTDLKQFMRAPAPPGGKKGRRGRGRP